MNEPSTTAIPSSATRPIDLSAIAGNAAALAKADRDVVPSRTISLADANVLYSFVHCCDCGVGGHTGHTLYTIIKNVATLMEAKACARHVGQYIRPKDLKKRRKGS